jgi:hypothetical protein
MGRLSWWNGPQNSWHLSVSFETMGSLFVASYDSQRYLRWRYSNPNFIPFKFKLHWDRRSVGQFVLMSGPQINFLCLTISFFFMQGALSDEWRICNLQCITHCVESRRTHNHTLLSHLRLHQHGAPGSRIYISQEQGGPVTPPGNGFHFRGLLRLAGLQALQVQVILRPTVSRPVRLGVGPLVMPMTKILIFFVWQLLFHFHIGRPLLRGDGSVICSAITHWVVSRRTHNHI